MYIVKVKISGLGDELGKLDWVWIWGGHVAAQTENRNPGGRANML